MSEFSNPAGMDGEWGEASKDECQENATFDRGQTAERDPTPSVIGARRASDSITREETPLLVHKKTQHKAAEKREGGTTRTDASTLCPPPQGRDFLPPEMAAAALTAGAPAVVEVVAVTRELLDCLLRAGRGD